MKVLDRIRAATERAPFKSIAYVILPLAAIPRLWQMIFDQGVFWPDEIFQTLEQTHRFAFGYGWTPGNSATARGLVGLSPASSGSSSSSSFVGLTKSGVGVVMTVRTVMLGLALAGVHATMRIGERVGGSLGALLAGTSVAVCPALIVYGTRCMTEMASGPLLAIAAVLVMEGTWKRAWIAALLASLAIFFRYQNGLFALTLFVYLFFNRHWKAALTYATTGLLGGALGGALDKLTWGHFFHSFQVYWKFNYVEGQAARWGVDAFDYYFETIHRSFGPAMWILLVGFVLSFRKQRLLPLLCVANLLVHAKIPHKEYRFLMPMLPIALGLAGGGLGWALGGLRRAPSDEDASEKPVGGFQRLRAVTGGWVATGLAVSLGILLARKAQTITFADMGQFRLGREDGWAPWNHEAGPNYAYWEAGQHDDLCGIITIGTPLISAGGYSYLHKNVPMYGSLSQFDLSGANYIAAPRLTPPPLGYSLVKSFTLPVRDFARSDGRVWPGPSYDYVLFRRDGACAAPPPWWSANFP
ncbi:MAG: hypothetical protein U0235_14410 [Polyangiaceae bacterium]